MIQRFESLVVQKTLEGAENFAQYKFEKTKGGLDAMLHVFHNNEANRCLLPSFIVSYSSN